MKRKNSLAFGPWRKVEHLDDVKLLPMQNYLNEVPERRWLLLMTASAVRKPALPSVAADECSASMLLPYTVQSMLTILTAPIILTLPAFCMLKLPSGCVSL